jgi:hypothetical protein
LAEGKGIGKREEVEEGKEIEEGEEVEEKPSPSLK